MPEPTKTEQSQQDRADLTVLTDAELKEVGGGRVIVPGGIPPANWRQGGSDPAARNNAVSVQVNGVGGVG